MDLGFERAGYTTQWVCEVDPWRRKILAKHFPQAEQHDDLSTLDPAHLAPVDVLIGGTPCQDLSHAGNRAGLEGERSRLFWDYMRIRNHMNIPWAVWENVYGALTSNNGLDFAQVLGAFVGCPVDVPAGGWPGAGVATGPWGGCCWRVLDAQHFGVPQRRRRVFVVGHLGGECPPSVLFESEGGSRSAPSGGETRADASSTFGVRVAGTLGAHESGGSDPTDFERMGAYVAGTVRSHARPGSNDIGGLVLSGPDPRTASADHREDGSYRGGVFGERTGGSRGDACSAISDEVGREAGAGLCGSPDRLHGAASDADGAGAPDGLARWLDGAVSAFDPLPDGRRDAATGDGVVAPVAQWIARRLATVMDGQVPEAER